MQHLGVIKMNQYIRDEQGKPLFVILPIAEYEKLVGVDEFGFPYDDETEDDLVSLSDDETDNEDDGVLIPFEVVKIKLEQNINLLGAWRIYRNLSQYEVAEKTGLTQSAISQMERKESKPQKKTLERFAKVYGCNVEQMY